MDMGMNMRRVLIKVQKIKYLVPIKAEQAQKYQYNFSKKSDIIRPYYNCVVCRNLKLDTEMNSG